MKDDKFSLSAMSVASIRAVESYRSEKDRLFEDPFALHFLKPGWRFVLHMLRLPIIGTSFLALRERQFPGTLGGKRWVHQNIKNVTSTLSIGI
ncbi:MAG: hypothetical protein HXS54_15885 [Theionarchaea archaeon]|nr:hypothetical protein [Theionarchaea archaeon]